MTLTLAATADNLIGYRADGRPILLHHGHDQWSTMFVEPDTGDDDDGDGADDEPDDDDDEPGATTPPAYTPPSQEEWERVQAAVKRNNAENKRHRQLAKALETRGIDLSTDDGQATLDDLLHGRTPADTGAVGQQGQDQNAAKREAQRAAERAAAKVEAKYKPALARAAAQAALTTAGWSGTASELARALKMVDLDDVDVDADGNVTGIADQIAEIKADIPSWFKAGEKAPAGERRRGAAEVDGGDRGTKTGAEAGNWLTKVDAQMTGSAR